MREIPSPARGSATRHMRTDKHPLQASPAPPTAQKPKSKGGKAPTGSGTRVSSQVRDRVSEGPCLSDGPHQSPLERKNTSLGSGAPLSASPTQDPIPHLAWLHWIPPQTAVRVSLCFPCCVDKIFVNFKGGLWDVSEGRCGSVVTLCPH